MFDLICFDCDGVLVASEVLAARTTADCLNELGVKITAEEALTQFSGKSAADAATSIRQTYGVELPDSYKARYSNLLFQRFRHELKAVAGMHEVLGALRTPSCVTSNSGHERLALTLEVTGFANHFGSRVFSADDVARGKPAPDLFHFAAKRMGVEPSCCLVIDDSPIGINGAVAAGARAIGFTGGGHTTADHVDRLMAAGACCTVDTARDILPLVYGEVVPSQ